MTTAEQIKQLRSDAKLTQAKLAGLIGKPQSRVAEWETGVYEPSYKMMVKIIEVCTEIETLSNSPIPDIRITNPVTKKL